MLTALNGILIVTMLFCWGLSSGNKWVVAASFVAAGAAWFANTWHEIVGTTLWPAASVSVAAVVFGYAAVFLNLITR